MSNLGHAFALEEIRDDYLHKCDAFNEFALCCHRGLSYRPSLCNFGASWLMRPTQLQAAGRDARPNTHMLEQDTAISVLARARKSGSSEGCAGAVITAALHADAFQSLASPARAQRADGALHERELQDGACCCAASKNQRLPSPPPVRKKYASHAPTPVLRRLHNVGCHA